MLNVNKIDTRIGNYLSGFADGEGSFMVVVRKRNDYKNNWKISLCFNVSQKETYILSQFKKHLRCGTLRKRPDGVSYYEVNNLKMPEEYSLKQIVEDVSKYMLFRDFSEEKIIEYFL